MSGRSGSRSIVLPLAAGRMLADATRRRSPPRSPRRVLVAHHLLLGDTIMLTPLLAKCRERWPEADIVMTCAPSYCGLYARRPYGVRAVPYDPRDAGSLRRLRAEAGFDLALLPADNRLSWLARALDARWVVAFAGDTPAYKNWPIDELRRYPEVPMAWGDLVAGLVDGPVPASYRTVDWPQPPADAFKVPSAPYCVMHAGASTPLKQWSVDRWRDLAQRLARRGLQVVLSTGPGETQLLEAIDPAASLPRYGGTLSLPQLWHLLSGAALLVAPDTGVAHLGRLVGVPTVALFGPGSALLSGAGKFWRDSPFTALTIPDFPCRDQTITMKRSVSWVRRCERFLGTEPGQCAEARCMLALDSERVWHAVSDRLAMTA